MKTVSVIVPVYNAEKTVTHLLGNLLHQTLPDMEVILVNDTSTDNSLKILSDAKAQFPDTVVLIDSPENKGPGGARNLALDVAQGAYIGFADADDLLDTRMYELLYNKATEGDYDIVDCGFLDEEHDRAVCFTGDDCTGVLNDRQRSDLIVAGGYLWSRIYRKSLFTVPKKLLFRERCTLSDADSLTALIARASSAGNVKEILYRYHYDPHSVSRLLHDPPRYCKNLMAAMQGVYDAVCFMPNYEGLRDAVEYEILQMFSYAVNMSYKGLYDRSFPAAGETLRQLVSLGRRLVRSIRMEENPYVKAKIPGKDLQLMRQAIREYG